MRKVVLGIVGLAILATCCSGPASATVYGALTIKQIQDPGTAPNPIGIPNPSGSAAGDTVGPVCGIITGFDHFPSGFAVYIQSSQGGGWTGIDVFTGGRNLFSEGYALGDSICVQSCALAEFSTVTAPCALAGVDGETEIISKRGSFGASTELPIVKISAGHPLPPFHFDTVAGLQELCSNGNAEQWEGCLVRVEGPLRICRTNPPHTVLGSFRSVLVVDSTACPTGHVGACDSMFIDLATLSDPALSTGNVGQIIDFVQGIYNERSRGYRIQTRDGADYGIQAPPALVRAYAIATNKYRVIVDRAVTAGTATNRFNYTLLSTLGPPDAAVQVNGTTIDLTVTGTGLSGGDGETVTVNGLTAAGSGLTMTSGQQASFHFDVLSPALVQGGDSDSLAASPCRDVGRFQTGGPTTIRGIVQAKFENTYYLSATNGARDGMAVFAPPSLLTVGKRYVIVGTVAERFDETQMSTILYVADEGVAPNPASVTLTIPVAKNQACDFPSPNLGTSSHLTNGEDYEDMLVKLVNVKVCENDLTGRNFQVTTWPPTTDSIFVANLTATAYTYTPVLGDIITVTGILHYSFGDFEICPRTDADIVVTGLTNTNDNLPTSVSFSVAPNPGQKPRLTFALPTAGKVELGVYDVLGRQVAVVARGEFLAGVHTRLWNGLDSQGNAAKAGMYFYKLKLDSGVHTIRSIKID